MRVATFLLPFILGFGSLGVVGFLLSAEQRGIYWGLITGYFLPPLGKESIIPLGIAAEINPIVMALSIAFVDVVVALFLLWNYDLAKKIPFIGKFMTTVEEKGKNVQKKYGWVKPLRFVGIVLFVMVPFQGSGGLVGSIVGRLIGMKPWNTFYAICIGSLVGCLSIAFFAHIIKILAQINTELTLLLIAGIVIAALLYFIIKKRTKRPRP